MKRLRLLHRNECIAETRIADRQAAEIGSTPEADLFIPRAVSSRVPLRAVKLSAENAVVFAEPLQRVVKIKIDGRPLDARLELKRGWAELAIAESSFTLRVDDA